ncbi:MAG: hypothetical protein ACOYD0_13120 [Candidatus Nanopelagicales bacterium]
MLRTLRLIASAAALAGLVVFAGATGALAEDCVGPDDPPGCVTPAPTVTPDPTPSATVSPDPTPEPTGSVSPSPAVSVTPDAVTVTTLDPDQFDAFLWVGGALLAVSLIGLVGSWSR